MISRTLAKFGKGFTNTSGLRTFSNISNFDDLTKAITAIDHDQAMISAIFVGEDWHPQLVFQP